MNFNGKHKHFLLTAPVTVAAVVALHAFSQVLHLRPFRPPRNDTSFSLTGRARVLDGDTLRINGRRIRLHGMDAPEMHQTCRNERGRRWHCGIEARRHLVSLIGGVRISCYQVTTDHFGRMVAVCRRGRMDLGRRMVRDGWAVAYVRYSRAYVQEETQAKRNRRGIWRGSFVRPEDWRHDQPHIHGHARWNRHPWRRRRWFRRHR